MEEFLVDEEFDEELENEPKICNTCANCQCIGEGDHVCIADEPVLVLEDYMPTDDFYFCNGENYEEY